MSSGSDRRPFVLTAPALLFEPTSFVELLFWRLPTSPAVFGAFPAELLHALLLEPTSFFEPPFLLPPASPAAFGAFPAELLRAELRAPLLRLRSSLQTVAVKRLQTIVEAQLHCLYLCVRLCQIAIARQSGAHVHGAVRKQELAQ